jgi:hypothetical protein|eukprot:scaffold8850_cov134-Isochrysis_galbana.AAC.6
MAACGVRRVVEPTNGAHPRPTHLVFFYVTYISPHLELTGTGIPKEAWLVGARDRHGKPPPRASGHVHVQLAHRRLVLLHHCC